MNCHSETNCASVRKFVPHQNRLPLPSGRGRRMTGWLAACRLASPVATELRIVVRLLNDVVPDVRRSVGTRLDTSVAAPPVVGFGIDSFSVDTAPAEP